MLKQREMGSIEYEIFRNATVKGFELTLEISGKLLRKAIKPYFASSQLVDKLTYKEVFRHAAKHSLMSVEEVERWFNYRDNRNTIAHDYGESFAEETLTLLPDFIADAKKLQEQIAHVEY
jgi:nucleotidyltransferase substrate binding protein (TIGR01987 family)